MAFDGLETPSFDHLHLRPNDLVSIVPFQGLTNIRTTEPPRLSSDHPLRVTFYRHGANSGRHWLAYILLSVALAVLVCYPVCCLYEDPATGFSKLPHHVWTSARRWHGNQSIPVDVEVRQIWIHGSFMKALEHEILRNALDFQNDIISSGSHPDDDFIPALVTERCQLFDGDHPDRGIHSPLMYWNCSSEVIDNDTDFLHTINSQTMRMSYLNLTLRPSSVLAGKAFSEKKLKAADALVITLFDRSMSIKSSWEKRLAHLVSYHSNRWSFHPPSGKSTFSQLYQFQYKPVSMRDDILLLIAYSLMFLYVILALKKTRAVKSQLGVIIAIITEMLVSVFASFSICGLLGIDLAGIPQGVFPFVVLVIGLEHMFRLINAVLEYPPQMAPTIRIANALGDVGHLALVASTENLFFLYLLQKLVSPGVQSFCIFASVALVFDFFFHLMFFVAVLHVEVRRMELQDSFDRTSIQSRSKQRAQVQRLYWFDAFLQGRTPVITRIAGSAVSICFVIFLNLQFSDSDSIGRSLIRCLMSPFRQSNNHENSMFSSSPINSARTPQTWLRLQDYQSAREVITYVKPEAHVLIARIYEPLVLVFKGSDRSNIPLQETVFWKFWKVAQNHIYMFILVLISIIAVVTLLMQYLLWNEIADESTNSVPPVARMSVKRIAGRSHTLDIYKVFTNARGQILVLDLDRNMILYSLDETQQAYSSTPIRDYNYNKPTWTNDAVRIDANGKWLVVWTPKGMIESWNLAEMVRVASFQSLRQPVLVDFAYSGVNAEPQLLVMSINGMIHRWSVEGSKLGTTKISARSTIKFAELTRVDHLHQIISLDVDGEIYVTAIDLMAADPSASIEFEDTPTKVFHEIDPRLVAVKSIDKARRVSSISALSLLMVQRSEGLDLIHFETGLLIHRIPIPHDHAPISDPRLTYTVPRPCQLCKSPSVAALRTVYSSKPKKSCIIQTFTRNEFNEDFETTALMCLRPTGNIKAGTCKGLATAIVHTDVIENDTGAWDVTGSQVVTGIRKQRSVKVDAPLLAKSYSSSLQTSGLGKPTALRSRFFDKTQRDDKVVWEIWSFDTTTSTLTIEPLKSDSEQNIELYGQDLLVTEPGPVVSLGKRTVVLAMGVTLRTVTVGSDRIELMEVEGSKRPATLMKLGSKSLEGRKRSRPSRTYS